VLGFKILEIDNSALTLVKRQILNTLKTRCWSWFILHFNCRLLRARGDRSHAVWTPVPYPKHI